MSRQSIPKTYHPKAHEAEIYQNWQTQKLGNPELQAKEQNLDTSKEARTILMPPPNLTGNLHAGHAFQHYLSDTLIRVWRQKGQQALWFPGVDHAGIQLEGVIDKLIQKGEFDEVIKNSDIQVKNRKISGIGFLQQIQKPERAKILKKGNRELWLELAWSKVNLWRENQQELAKLLGDTPDYDRSLFTLDEQSAKMVEYAFRKYWEDGLIYKSEYLINWSVGLQTALSDIAGEIEYDTRQDPFVTFEYRLENLDFTDSKEAVYEEEIRNTLNKILVSTVRPETIHGDIAIAVHPLILQKRLSQTSNPVKIYDLIQKQKITLSYSIESLNQQNVRLILAEEVDPEFGTGALKITPASSLEDYKIWSKYLKADKPEFPFSIERSGLLSPICGEFSGLNVEQGRLAITKRLAETGFIPVKAEFASLRQEVLQEVQNNLANQKFNPKDYTYRKGIKTLRELIGDKLEIDWDYEHNVTLCERSKTVVEPLISEEYFVSYQNRFDWTPTGNGKSKSSGYGQKTNLQELGLKAIEEIDWYPKSLKERCQNFVENIQDWTISRDLVWGHRIPVWYNLDTNPSKILYGPNEFQVDKKVQISLTKPTVEGSWVQEEKILDTWFSSCLWPLSTLNLPEFLTTRPEFVFVHGGEYYPTREAYKVAEIDSKTPNLKPRKSGKKWRVDLANFLAGNGINLIQPQMPLADFANYGEWKAWFEKYLDLLKEENLNLIGHSLGGYFLLKYLSENDLQVDNLILVAAGTELGEGCDSFTSDPNKYSQIQENCQNIYIFHSQDDPIVPYSEAEKIAQALPQAKLITHSNKQHYILPQIPEIKDIITTYLTEYNQQKPTDFETYYPTQTMVTGVDILYIWIVRMALLGKYFTGQTPYKDVVVHPTVLDEKGRKMSKSLGNGLDVTSQIDRFSSDSTRLALLSGMIPGRNFRMGGKLADKITEKYRNFGNKIWNVGRFLWEK